MFVTKYFTNYKQKQFTMQKLLFRTLLLLVALIITNHTKAQNVIEVPYTNFSNAPKVDGLIDSLWNNVPMEKLSVAFSNESVSFTVSSTLQATWDNQNIYVLVSVFDDDFYPASEANLASWQADKVELYFDVNDTILDGKGPSQGTYAAAGHYQVTSPFAGTNDAILTPHTFAYSVSSDSSSYFCEYAIPFSSLINNNGNEVDPYIIDTIGFDATIIDLDEIGKGKTTDIKQRKNWNNDGAVAESWVSLDNCGRMVFTGGQQCDTSYNTTITAEILLGDSLEFYGNYYKESGIYVQDFFTELGCDSTITLELNVFEGKLATIDYTAYTKSPIVDGNIDTLWNNVPKYEINTPFNNENVSFNAVATWQATWDNQNVYMLITVPDDNFLPHTDTTLASWLADKVEVFFDVNDTIIDGGAPSPYNTNKAGHYQFAPGYDEIGENKPSNHEFAFKVSPNDDTYICEYAFPFSSMRNKEGIILNPYSNDTIGFDITIIDLDEKGYPNDSIRQRVNWNTDARYGESWNNMDNCGRLVFKGGYECTPIDTIYWIDTLASNEVYEFFGKTLYTEGVYNKTIVTELGCDSVYNLTLYVEYDSTTQIEYIPNFKPAVDGDIEEIWNAIPRKVIDVPFYTETVSFTGNATWRSVWNDSSLFILVSIPDDNFHPHYDAGTETWGADKPELYFDVNDNIIDGGGPDWEPGHYLFSPAFNAIGDNAPKDIKFGFSVENDAFYVCEYEIPFSVLIDDSGNALNPILKKHFGFDITIIDLDEFGKGENANRGRINYSNPVSDGVSDSWSIMDASAQMELVGYNCENMDTTKLDETICAGESVQFGSEILFESGIYYRTVLSQYYCDSVIELTLIVNEVEVGISQNDEILTADASNAEYQWVNCSGGNYSVINEATSQSFTVTESGDYAVIVTQNNCSDTSDCTSVTIQSIDSKSTNNIKLYPNPVSNKLNFDFNTAFSEANIEVYNAIGTLITTKVVQSESNYIDISNLNNGIYIVRIAINGNIFNYQVIKH